MAFTNADIKNIILPQINFAESFFIREIKPFFTEDSSTIKSLVLNENLDLMWTPSILNIKNSSIGYSIFNKIEGNTAIFNVLKGTENIQINNDNGIITIDCSISYTENNRLKGTNIYCIDDKIGLGRTPLKEYKFDIGIQKDTLTTALHVGDGSAGFSMGNGTTSGFIPQIIGMGIDENDTGLYFIGRAGNNVASSVPLIIIDGRDLYNKELNNRPIFGITSGSYTDYKFLINHNGNTLIDGKLYVNDIIINKDISSLVNVIYDMQDKINQLEEMIKSLTES